MAEGGEPSRNHLIEEMKRHAVLAALSNNKTPQEIIAWTGYSSSMVYRVKAEWEREQDLVAILSKGRKRQGTKSVRTRELIDAVQEAIDEEPTTSIRNLAARFGVSDGTMTTLVHEDLRCKSYKLRIRQALNAAQKKKRLDRARALYDAVRYDDLRKIRFFSDEKMFSVEQTVNHQNDRWLAREPASIPIVERDKYPAHVHVLGVVSSEGDVMPPHFFEDRETVNQFVYHRVLETVVVPWMNQVARGRPYVFQQDGAPAHNSNLVQNYLRSSGDVSSFWDKNAWPPNSPDLNPLDYYFWSVIERESNKRKHSNKDSLRDAIREAFANIPREQCKLACARFRSRLLQVIEAEGGWFE